MKPFRLSFKVQGNCDGAGVVRNIEASRHFAKAQRREHSLAVAVVGGSPSLDIESVRKWPGDIWAINHTADFLQDRGIDCTLFSVDPAPMTMRAQKRLLATHCDPGMFIGDVQCFSLSDYEQGGILGGTTSATRAPLLALQLGYPGVTFFGCESSFAAADHVDRDEQPKLQILIKASGSVWKTTPQMLLQAQELSWLIKHCPVLSEQSGGLLRAMLNDDDWEVVGVNAAMKQHLIDINGDAGLYDEPYRPS